MKKQKQYTLRKISRQECERRKLFVYEIGNPPLLIALESEYKTFKRSDPSTWGHLYKGGKTWGKFLKLRKRYKIAWLICEKPMLTTLKICKNSPCIFTGNPDQDYHIKINGQTTYRNYSFKGAVQSLKQRFNYSIGTFIK